MRIHYVSHAAIPSREANSLQVMKMCAAFARAGHTVVHFCRPGPEAGDAHAFYGLAPSFRIERVAGGGLPIVRRLRRAWRLAARLAREPVPDLVYGRDFHSLALLALRGRLVAPLVLEVHQPPRNRLEHALQLRLFRQPGFARLVCISAALAEEYRRRFGPELGAPLVVAPDGADEPAEPAPAAARANGLALGYVGHLYPGKGLELIERLAARLPRCAFHVLGGEAGDVAAWRARLARPNVHLHGHVPHAEAQRRMRAFDVLLAPYQAAVLIGGGGSDVSRWMSPLKVFEYMASGRPMIASDLPVLREVLRDGENALLARADDVEAWARAVERLEADPDLARRLAERALAELRARYTWDRRVELVLAAPSSSLLAP
ncbi:MAG TPA: glycosyltransferase family 4 protein [Planctomycetota bacterium]